MNRFITLSSIELQSGLSRLRFAEDLILQLPLRHNGRNTWLLNYGTGTEAQAKREIRNIKWSCATQSAQPVEKNET